MIASLRAVRRASLRSLTLAALLTAHLTGVARGQSPTAPGVGQRYDGRYYSAHNPGGSWSSESAAYLDGEISKNIQSNLLQSMMLSNAVLNELVRQELLIAAGKAAVAEGRATTKFTWREEASTLGQRVPAEASPEERARALAAAEESLAGFEANLRKEGCEVHDMADATALAYVMAFAALRELDPGPARLAYLRARFRKEMLADYQWLGRLDDDRQAEYEQVGVAAMMAVTARAGSRDTTLPAERRAALDRVAREFATGVLRAYTKATVEGLELTADGFGDRGERLASTGTGTTTFKRVEPPFTTREYAGRWGFTCNYEEQPFIDKLRRFDRVVLASGGRTDDVADANAAAFALHYFVQSGGAVELSRAQVEWVRSEMRRDLMASAAYQALPDEAKQRLYETLALDAMRGRDTFAEAQRELAVPAATDPFERWSQLSMQQFSVESIARERATSRAKALEIFQPRRLEEFVLTANGFEPSGKSAPITAQAPTSTSPAAAAFRPLDGLPLETAPVAGPAVDPPAHAPGVAGAPAIPPSPSGAGTPGKPATTTFERRASQSVLESLTREVAYFGVSLATLRSMLAAFDATVVEFDGSTSDVADGQALAFVLCYDATVDEDGALDEDQVAGIRAFFRARALADAALQRAGDADRQAAYERLAVRVIRTVEAVEAAAPGDDPSGDSLERMRRALLADQAAQAKAAARTLLDELLAPKTLADHRITPTGMVAKPVRTVR